jgi:prepilin-type N-terminal cleavage/methylation domain-containing protein
MSNMNMKKSRQTGFTLIELMFAMALLGFILIFSLTVISQLISTYNRGLSLIQVNQAIRQLDNDFNKSLRFVSPNTVVAYYFTSKGDKIDAFSDTYTLDPGEKIVAGSICVKDVAYIWNLGTEKFSDDNSDHQFFYYKNSSTPLRFLRINLIDNEGYCNGTSREIDRGNAKLDIVSLLGSQSMVMYADIKKVHGFSTTGQPRLFNIHLVLSSASSASSNFEPQWVNENGSPKGDNEDIDFSRHHLTCVNTKKRGEFCSFGEFNSIIYTRGQ